MSQKRPKPTPSLKAAKTFSYFFSLKFTHLSFFINRFTFDNFDTPQEYFKTLISSVENNRLPYPLRQYGFRLNMGVPDTDIYAIVNQNIENITTNKFIYTFDIDVLDRQRLIFNVSTIIENLETLRNVKNEIFFNNLTQKTLDLCN